MGDYYKQRINARREIRQIIEDNGKNDKITDIKALCFNISNSYGFLDKFTINYLAELEEVGIIQYSDDKTKVNIRK